MHTITDLITQSYLHTIVRVDPNTTRLVPVDPQPQLGICAAKFGQRHLLIGAIKVSMSKLAYFYHHGTLPKQVTHLDRNPDNYAPENLVPYRPAGRALNRPIPSAISLHDAGVARFLGKLYRAVLLPPASAAHGKPILLTDGMGYDVVAKTEASAKRLAAAYAKNLTPQQKETLGIS